MTYDVANPAVIIGLGGSGKWVLTYIKKNLLDTYGGQIPSTIKLLSFDTTQEKVSHDGRQQEEEARVGNVQLDRGEFTYLGGNIRPICLAIRDKREYPHVSSWLQARTYLETADPDAFDIGQGAGQKRPFGRMAIFYNLHAQVQAELSNRIRQAIIDVNAANKRKAAIEIYVVASLAGGTGSGMFIDVAHLARWFASKNLQTGGFAIRGFLALQNTFRSVLSVNQVEANAAAAMRELDRFMLVFDQYYKITYNPSNPSLHTIYGGNTGKLFDNCYLLDASREHLPLDDIKPQYGVYPSIADCISMLLDASTGDVYDQHYKNVNTRITEVQSRINQPIYSSLGTFSLILPVEDIITSLKYRFAIDLLTRHLVRLEKRKDENNQEQVVLLYEGDARNEALDFLRTPRSGSGLESTQFIMNTPGVIERNIQAVDYQREVAETPSAGLLTWLLPPESDPTVLKIAKDVREILQIQLIDQVQPSDKEGDDYVAGSDRVAAQSSRFKDKYLGRDVGGRRSGGEYRTALQHCVTIQRQRYRDLLQEFLIDTLNGTAPTNSDFQQERRGRLGYVRDVLAHLSQAFNRVDTFLEFVRTYRAQTDQMRERRESAANARAEMSEQSNRGSFLGTFIKGIHPAVRAQNEYLELEQDVIDYEVNELLIEHLRLTSEALREVTDEHKEAIDSWINTLVLGLSGEFSDPGAYNQLLVDAKRHATARADKRNIRVHEYVTDDKYEDSLYNTHTVGRFEEAMARLVWQIDTEDKTHFKLTLSGLNVATSQHIQGQQATSRNVAFLLSMAHNYFEPLRSLNIADRLAENREAAGLALNLTDKCSPMIRFDPQRQGSHESSRFVCVNKGDQPGFFQEFDDAFRRLGSTAKDNQVLPAANKYTCTMLSTADVISSYGLVPYISAEEAYNQHVGDARLLHIFPAEVNAVQLEQQLPERIREPRRKFAPRLTAMLEDRERVEQFVLCYLYGLITLEAAGGVNNRYVLTYEAKKDKRRSVGRFELTQSDRTSSLFTAMETFTFRGSDINSEETTMDFQQIDHELRRFEAQVMGAEFSIDPRTHESKADGGDASRLINLLEQQLDGEVDRLRRETDDVQKRDLGSVMALIINEIIDGLHQRLTANNLPYNPESQPLIQPRASTGTVSPTPTATDGHAEPAVQETVPAEPQNDLKRRLKRLEEMYQDGEFTQEEYEERKQRLQQEARPKSDLGRRLKRLEEMYQDGEFTREEYEERKQRLQQEARPKPDLERRRAHLEEMYQDGEFTREEYEERLRRLEDSNV